MVLEVSALNYFPYRPTVLVMVVPRVHHCCYPINRRTYGRTVITISAARRDARITNRMCINLVPSSMGHGIQQGTGRLLQILMLHLTATCTTPPALASFQAQACFIILPRNLFGIKLLCGASCGVGRKSVSTGLKHFRVLQNTTQASIC